MGGAFTFVPVTAGQLKELSLQLRPYHILALRSDKQNILRALKCLSSRARPHLRGDHRAAALEHEPPAKARRVDDARRMPGDEVVVQVVEEFTFLSLRSDGSASSRM